MQQMNLDDMINLLEALSPFLRLTPHNDVFAQLDIVQPITTDPDSNSTLSPGTYLIDYDANIYYPHEPQEVLPGFSAVGLTPVKKPHSGTMNLASLIFYIGEYMDIPETANQLLGFYFSKGGKGAVTEARAEQAGLLMREFLPMLNGNPTNSVMGISSKYLTADGITGVATYKKNGHTIQVKDFADVSAHLGTSAKKLLDASVLYLTDANFYKGDNVNPTAIIPLEEYWKAQGYPITPADDSPEEQTRVENLIKWLKKGTRADCQALQSIKWDGYIGTGKNKSQVASYYFVSSWRFLRGNRLKINFDIDLASYLVHAYQMQFPVVLLALDNRKPNSYAIGRRIALHHSMDNNAAIGTSNTISVKTLLEAAPEIPTYETLIASNQRNWKRKIKGVLESALNDLVSSAPYLSNWEYRDPKAEVVTTYTPETASSLSWDQYSRLVIDFTLTAEPNQAERRAKKAAGKEAAAAGKPLKKRGRPSKATATDGESRKKG